MGFWDRQIETDAGRTTIHDFVENKWTKWTDREIADFLTRAGHECSQNRVRKFRFRQGWMKMETQQVRRTSDGVRREESTNALVVEAEGAGIKTLEDLLAAAKVDTDTWEVDRWVVNKWPVGAKARDASLSWDGGVMSGTVEEHGLTVAPLWQVKAWLVRKEPLVLFPTVRPMECPAVKRGETRARGGMRRTVVWADPHFGYYRDGGELVPLHDASAIALVLAVAKACGADRIDVLGDVLDLADWSSRFVRSPEFCACTQPAVVDAHRCVASFREELPDAVIKVHEGNHGKRLRDALADNLRAAYDLRAADEMDLPPALSIPRLLALHLLDAEWVGGYPGDDDWLNDRVRLSHGERYNSGPGDTAKNAAEHSDVVELFGHCHRLEMASRTMHVRGGTRVIQGWALGCTCHVDGRVPAKSARVQWQQGFAVVDYDPDGDAYHVDPVLVEGGRACWNGKVYGE